MGTSLPARVSETSAWQLAFLPTVRVNAVAALVS
jgi:hypothetical protein